MGSILKSHSVIIRNEHVLLLSVDSKVLPEISFEALVSESFALTFSISILDLSGENIGNPEHQITENDVLVCDL